jgi:hypothetical protein
MRGDCLLLLCEFWLLRLCFVILNYFGWRLAIRVQGSLHLLLLLNLFPSCLGCIKWVLNFLECVLEERTKLVHSRLFLSCSRLLGLLSIRLLLFNSLISRLLQERIRWRRLLLDLWLAYIWRLLRRSRLSFLQFLLLWGWEWIFVVSGSLIFRRPPLGWFISVSLSVAQAFMIIPLAVYLCLCLDGIILLNHLIFLLKLILHFLCEQLINKLSSSPLFFFFGQHRILLRGSQLGLLTWPRFHHMLLCSLEHGNWLDGFLGLWCDAKGVFQFFSTLTLLIWVKLVHTPITLRNLPWKWGLLRKNVKPIVDCWWLFWCCGVTDISGDYIIKNVSIFVRLLSLSWLYASRVIV